MKKNKRLILSLIIVFIILLGVGFITCIKLLNRDRGTINEDDTCCTCLDCPMCDVCCDCKNPYLNS